MPRARLLTVCKAPSQEHFLHVVLLPRLLCLSLVPFVILKSEGATCSPAKRACLGTAEELQSMASATGWSVQRTEPAVTGPEGQGRACMEALGVETEGSGSPWSSQSGLLLIKNSSSCWGRTRSGRLPLHAFPPRFNQAALSPRPHIAPALSLSLRLGHWVTFFSPVSSLWVPSLREETPNFQDSGPNNP